VRRTARLATLLVSGIIPVLRAKERFSFTASAPLSRRFFIADADGSDEHPLLPNSGFDYNARSPPTGSGLSLRLSGAAQPTSIVCTQMSQASNG
jgi:hypothetical protein